MRRARGRVSGAGGTDGVVIVPGLELENSLARKISKVAGIVVEALKEITLTPGDPEYGIEILRAAKSAIDEFLAFDAIRDDYSCRYCGDDFSAIPLDLTLDHLFPVSRGGVDEMWNLATACRSCNSKKGARTPAEAAVGRCEQAESDFMLSSRSLPLHERMRRAAELKRATANAMIVCASWAMERGK